MAFSSHLLPVQSHFVCELETCCPQPPGTCLGKQLPSLGEKKISTTKNKQQQPRFLIFFCPPDKGTMSKQPLLPWFISASSVLLSLSWPLSDVQPLPQAYFWVQICHQSPQEEAGGLAQPGTTQLQTPPRFAVLLPEPSPPNFPPWGVHPVPPSCHEHLFKEPEAVPAPAPAPSCASTMFG